MLMGCKYARKLVNMLRDHVKCCDCGCYINRKTDKYYLKPYKSILGVYDRIFKNMWSFSLSERFICEVCSRNIKLKKLI